MNKFFPINKVLSQNKSINIIVTATGTRKTTYFAEWAKEQVAQGKIVVWVRRRKDDISNTVVDLFRETFMDDPRFNHPYITSQGVKAGDFGKCIYFIPLSLYYKYKGLTKIAERLAGIVYDEAVPMDKEWIGGDPSAEERAFMRLTNIVIRPGTSAPIYFVCNPNILGSWQIHKWFPKFRPDSKKEKLEVNKKEDALIYSMPWLGGNRGTIEKLEDEEEKQITKYGVFRSREYDYLTTEKPGRHICSLIIGSKELELSRKKDKFIVSEPVRRTTKKRTVCFARFNLIHNPNSVIGDKVYYSDWLASLWSRERLKFTNPVIKTFLENKLDNLYSW